ncbi:MAG: hypothetical protein ACRCWP_14850 [Shewanella sp.]
MRQALCQLQQENKLSCQLARELASLIETVPYQQNTLELKCLELLACSQQKNRSLMLLMQMIKSVDIEPQRQRQYQFSQRLNLLICEWQQHREMNKLNQQFIPLLRHYLIESQALELGFYQHIQQKIIQATNVLPDHNRHAQSQS